jgi:protein-arginine deiminase
VKDFEPIQLDFFRKLDEARANAGIAKRMLLLNQFSDILAQDFIEPGYASIQGQTVSFLQIILRSAQ